VRITINIGVRRVNSCTATSASNAHTRCLRQTKILQAGERVTYRFAFVMGLGKGNYSVALSLSRLDSHLDRNFEWRDYGLVFHVINNRHEDFVGCSWLGAKTSITRANTSITSERTP
jgi:lipopolysaccharide transport system ATP-binding protein